MAARLQRKHQRAAPALPKKTDPRAHTVEDLRRTEDGLNHRPHKILGHRAPAGIYATELLTP
ncbi:hypothetical protein GCM10022232_83340 [Streptomyces plumbiresistens]|uniref:Transposase n=1 Tax=Streptomyces plumbiresistens TaxID=511811 RepID=A0ABP7TFC7_9ACTN